MREAHMTLFELFEILSLKNFICFNIFNILFAKNDSQHLHIKA